MITTILEILLVTARMCPTVGTFRRLSHMHLHLRALFLLSLYYHHRRQVSFSHSLIALDFTRGYSLGLLQWIISDYRPLTRLLQGYSLGLLQWIIYDHRPLTGLLQWIISDHRPLTTRFGFYSDCSSLSTIITIHSTHSHYLEAAFAWIRSEL